MKIAVTYEDGQVFQHFGHTERFKIYDIKDGEIASTAVVNTNGSGHGALAGVLKNLDVDVLICGGIGGGAQTALREVGIRLFVGVSGDTDKAVEALLEDKLVFSTDATCNHHEHHEGEGCHCGDHHEHHDSGDCHCGGKH